LAQIIYLDLRGNGRSDAGPKEAWNLCQWGDDVRGFCDVLEIERPIVLGVSFGGKSRHGLRNAPCSASSKADPDQYRSGRRHP
jgi:pimeloyl-ACP methyl ester carboxylesterase